MLTLLERFERLIACILGILLVFVILSATIDLTIGLIKNVLHARYFLVDVDHLVEVFGLFLFILLGLELLESVRAYLRDDLIHVEVVLMVALIALARKVIILELKDTTPMMLVGVAALVLSLAGGYRLIIQVLRNDAGPAKSAEKKR